MGKQTQVFQAYIWTVHLKYTLACAATNLALKAQVPYVGPAQTTTRMATTLSTLNGTHMHVRNMPPSQQVLMHAHYCNRQIHIRVQRIRRLATGRDRPSVPRLQVVRSTTSGLVCCQPSWSTLQRPAATDVFRSLHSHNVVAFQCTRMQNAPVAPVLAVLSYYADCTLYIPCCTSLVGALCCTCFAASYSTEIYKVGHAQEFAQYFQQLRCVLHGWRKHLAVLKLCPPIRVNS